ncbi:MAG TPA: EAL domain-containing protein [Candidatus Acidoferrum sp.]
MHAGISINDYLQLLPQEMVVEEILETVAEDEEVIAACKRIKKQGYRFALDDFCEAKGVRPLMRFVDFVKIDVQMTSFEEQARLIAKCHGQGIPVVAEKVETNEKFRRCMGIGYDYFQAYIFYRPQIIGSEAFPPTRQFTCSCCKSQTNRNLTCIKLR